MRIEKKIIFCILAIFAFAVAAESSERRNGKIAFTSTRDGNREIYVMEPDGTSQVRLTSNGLIDDHPVWSPDGSKIAFVSQRPAGGFAICTMNADGSNKTEITSINYHLNSERVFYWSMSWSPRGDRLVFEDGDDVFVININGTGRINLTFDSQDRALSPVWSPDGSQILYSTRGVLKTVSPDGINVRSLWQDRGGEFHVKWSPTGDRIVFAVDETDDCFWVQAIYLAPIDGTGGQTFHGGICAPALNLRPDWSPDGQKIVFQVENPLSEESEIHVKNIDGSGFLQLTDTLGKNFNPSWQGVPRLSRNGKIAFTSDRDGNREIYLMAPDGSNQRRLTNNTFIDDFPTWSPDGRRIAFLSQRSSGGYGIFSMDLDGSNRSEVTAVTYSPPSAWTGFDWRHMSWSPDGRQIVFTDLVGTVGTLFIVNADGTGRRSLTTGFYPAWSPDGSRILFLKANTPNPFYNLHTIKPDGSGPQFIPTSFANGYILWDSPPVWSPDGIRIALTSSDSANSEISMVNADGSNPQVLSWICAERSVEGCGANTAYPAWSPDGRQIAFAQYAFGSQSAEIYVQEIGSDIVKRLTDSPGSNSNPSWQPLPPKSAPFDFDGDGKTDFSVTRPGNPLDSTEFWYIAESGSGNIQVTEMGTWGQMVPADYDGDRKTDIAAAENRSTDEDEPVHWLIATSTGNVSGYVWGYPADHYVPADYDNDGAADLAVWRPSDGNWYIASTRTGVIRVQQWGLSGDKPTPADFDGDGQTDLAVYRPSEGKWYVFGSGSGRITVIDWGLNGDLAVQGDYSGDGRADFSVYRPSNNTWYRLHSDDFSMHATQWGLPNDIPTPGDYDGDYNLDLAVWRPSDGTWYVLTSSNSILTQAFGWPGDTPTPSSYVH